MTLLVIVLNRKGRNPCKCRSGVGIYSDLNYFVLECIDCGATWTATEELCL